MIGIYHNKIFFPSFDDFESTLQDEIMERLFNKYLETKKCPKIKIRYEKDCSINGRFFYKMVTEGLTKLNLVEKRRSKSKCFVKFSFFIKVDLDLFIDFLEIKGYGLIPTEAGIDLVKAVKRY